RCTVRYRGRNVSLLLDVAHKPHAAAYLAQRREPLGGRRLAVFGLMADKDLDGVLTPLLDRVDEWAVADLPTARSRSAQALGAAVRRRGITVGWFPSTAAALEAQFDRGGQGGEVLLFGSFYCVAGGLVWLGEA